jgi:hypothetical protein
MPETTDQPQKDFHWLPEYARAIADAANMWAYIEYYVNTSIWELAELPPAIGACITSQIYTLQGRLSALAALLKLRQADQKIIDSVNKFMERVRDAQDARNRIVHDMWMNDNLHPEMMGKLRITAEKKLHFRIASMPLDELKRDVEKIDTRRYEMSAIRLAIRAALPTLPEIPHAELYPIAESQEARQNRTTDGQ